MLQKPKRIVDETYKIWIKGHPCLVCWNPSDPHHLKSRGSGGSDYTCIPLCRKHHSELEQIGKKRFETKHMVDLWRECHRYLEGYVVKADKKHQAYGQ